MLFGIDAFMHKWNTADDANETQGIIIYEIDSSLISKCVFNFTNAEW